jgi:hypothetical protein
MTQGEAWSPASCNRGRSGGPEADAWHRTKSSSDSELTEPSREFKVKFKVGRSPYRALVTERRVGDVFAASYRACTSRPGGRTHAPSFDEIAVLRQNFDRCERLAAGSEGVPRSHDADDLIAHT